MNEEQRAKLEELIKAGNFDAVSDYVEEMMEESYQSGYSDGEANAGG